MNRFDVIGNVGKAPELRYLPSGKAVTTLSVATTRTWRDAAGDRVEKTTWFRIGVFDKMAENAAEFLKVGRLVRVSGYMENDEYERDGVTHYPMNYIAQEVEYLPSGAWRGEESAAPAEGDASAPPKAAPAPRARAPRATPPAGTGGGRR